LNAYVTTICHHARAVLSTTSALLPRGLSTGVLSTGVLFLATLFVLAAGAQDAPPGDTGETPGTTFFDSLDLTVVNVEVFVTDKAGRPIRDLDIDDFEIYEDGRQVKVTNFYAVSEGRPRTVVPLDTLEATAPGPVGSLPLVTVPEEQRLSLIVYVDNLFLRPFNRNNVLRQARGFLRRVLRGGDRAMVVSFDRGLHLRLPFTTDASLVEATLLELEELTGWGVQAQTERRNVIRRLDQVRDAFEAEGHVESYANARFFEVRQSIKALETQVKALAGLPGRKAILYISDGFPMTTAEDLYYLLDLRYPDRTGGQLAASRFRARRMIRTLTYEANAQRVTFYTIQAKGLRSQSSLSAESSSNDGSLIEIDTVYDASHEASIEMMARDTGGLAALGTNNIDGALKRVADDFGNYYSLGYVPSHSVAGRYHKLDVKVKRKGLRVRHRNGYREKHVETRLREATLAALRFGGIHNTLGIRVTSGQPRDEEGGRFLVPIEVRIPIGALALLPRQQEHRGKLQVSVAVKDEDGEVSPVTIAPLELSIPDRDIETARQQHYVYEVGLRMRKGIHNITIGVRDDLAGETSFAMGSVEVD
jgi:VWFA-related protein